MRKTDMRKTKTRTNKARARSRQRMVGLLVCDPPKEGSLMSLANHYLRRNTDDSVTRVWQSLQKSTRNRHASFPTRRFQCISNSGAEKIAGGGEPNGGYLYRVKAAVHKESGLRLRGNVPVAVGGDCNGKCNHNGGVLKRPNMYSANAGFGLVHVMRTGFRLVSANLASNGLGYH